MRATGARDQVGMASPARGRLFLNKRENSQQHRLQRGLTDLHGVQKGHLGEVPVLGPARSG